MTKSITQLLQDPAFLTLRTPRSPTHQIGLSTTPEAALESLSQDNADKLNSTDGGHQLTSTDSEKKLH